VEIQTEQFREVAQKELQNSRSRFFLKVIPPVMAVMRANALKTFPDPAAAQAYGAAIRAESVSRLSDLLEEFEKKAVANGATVLWAEDGQEANGYILKLARERGVEYITKGKSMVTEEMGLNDFLGENGIETWETDLGEFIIQQLHRPPFHLVGPAINIPVEEVCDLFMKKANLREPTLDPVQLGYAARVFLRDKFHRVKMGITGINLAVAETGTIITVENEGNIRLSKASPRTQVSIMTLEKVVPAMEDALHLLRLLCRNSSGRKISSYVTMDNGPKKKDEIDGPEELFIIIIDNRRTQIYQDRNTRQVLRCIRCGACLNFCPVYGQIGGYPYGWAYSGPLGSILSPLLLGLDRTQDLYRATTLCGVCKSVCPAGIDHPSLFLDFRAKDVAGDRKWKGKKRTWKENFFFKGWAWGANRSWRWNLGTLLIRHLWSRDSRKGNGGRLREHLGGWLKCRELPAFPLKTFHERWKQTNGDLHKN
jgi:L-lactate dehydrogenase complex protein LldF